MKSMWEILVPIVLYQLEQMSKVEPYWYRRHDWLS